MSSVCYIILTCERYLPTRATWLRENAFKYINPSDYYFLSCKPGPNSVYGWNTADDYNSCPWKYIEFFRNMDLNYDWYIFLDDDAFIFPNRYRENLSKLDHTKSLYIGHPSHEQEGMVFMGGSTSFVLTHSSYNIVKEYVRNNDMDTIQKCRHKMYHGDISLGQWITNINNSGKNYIEYMRVPFMTCHVPHQNEHQLQTSSTFHYLHQKEEYELYGQYVLP